MPWFLPLLLALLAIPARAQIGGGSRCSLNPCPPSMICSLSDSRCHCGSQWGPVCNEITEVCESGRCVAKVCAGVLCPMGLTCENGACVDLGCRGVLCPAGQVCKLGICHAPESTMTMTSAGVAQALAPGSSKDACKGFCGPGTVCGKDGKCVCGRGR